MRSMRASKEEHAVHTLVKMEPELSKEMHGETEDAREAHISGAGMCKGEGRGVHAANRWS